MSAVALREDVILSAVCEGLVHPSISTRFMCMCVCWGRTARPGAPWCPCTTQPFLELKNETKQSQEEVKNIKTVF